MRRLATIALLLLPAACGAPPPPDEGRRSQAMADATGHLIRSMDPCRMGRTDFEPSREFRDCLDLLPQERFRGVWYVGFEDMSFVPGAVSAPAVRVMDVRAARAPWIELAMPRGVGERLWRAAPEGTRGSQAVRIDFLGRRERPRRADSGTTIVVDRIYSMHVLGPTRTWVDLSIRPAGFAD